MKTNDNETRYMIVASCDPYHARFYYPKGAKVLRRDGATPVQWVQDDDFGYGYTKDQALRMLERFASDEAKGQTFYYDAESKDNTQWPVPIFDENGYIIGNDAEAAKDWYEGPGWYNCNQTLIYLKGREYYSYDVMSYSIEEMMEEGDD